jgi:hypothetical protein
MATNTDAAELDEEAAAPHTVVHTFKVEECRHQHILAPHC